MWEGTPALSLLLQGGDRAPGGEGLDSSSRISICLQRPSREGDRHVARSKQEVTAQNDVARGP